nr:Nitrogen assimilation transcription factor nit-4-like protein 1 [Colletotrichum truncatum]KAF6781808.1 Nitrogen assimilation transcription factor nit-4-like protein 1 [Colletotrichum truncatum]
MVFSAQTRDLGLNLSTISISPLVKGNGQQANDFHGNRLAKAPSDGMPCPEACPFCMTAFVDQDRGQNPDLCDPRLQQLDVSFWTNVPIANDYAARVISLYLTTDHPLLGIFDPELFVMDLVHKQATHCSHLLANSVLYWGCQMYTAIDEGASELADQFCKEAERLWLTEQNNDTILNTASAQLLSLAYLGHGKDHYVLKYLAAALGMGKRLFLFGVEPKEALTHLHPMSPEMQKAVAYTAWGVFNWGVLITLFYQQPDLDYPDHPPVLPIPGEAVSGQKHDMSPGFSSDMSEEHIPLYMGRTFPTLCRFWRIIHEVTPVYYKGRQSPLPDVSLDFAEFKYRELLALMDKLPSDQVLRDHCPHHVVIFHIWFHAAILDIFRPFMRQPQHGQLHLKTFSARRSTPDAAFHASVNQLKRLVIKFRCNYESSTYTLLWQTALIYVANAVLHDTDNPEWRFYFLVCIYGYEGLRKSYRVAEIVSQGLLTMTVRDGDISSSEARQLLNEIKEVEGSHASGDVRATFMVDLDLAMVDPEAARVENLAERFEDIALFRDFTTVEDEEHTRRREKAEWSGSDK